MVPSETQPVDFYEHIDELKSQLIRKDVLVFLDYDGTLTPIVDTPDLAVLSEAMRETVKALASLYKVSIISGRATADVRSKVKIDGLFYAGSHGFEIVDPDGEVKINDEAQNIRHVIDEVHEKLSRKLKGIEGALVEHVKYTISVHYRLVSDADFPKIERAVDEILEGYDSLRKSSGKKVFELKPRIDWHKGKAVEWILGVLNYDSERNTAVYIGDDVTDEDAFAALKGKGFGILVSESPRPSKAAYMVRTTDDVKDVLDLLIRLRST